MTRTISILPFLLLACDSSGSKSEKKSTTSPTHDSREEVSSTTHRSPASPPLLMPTEPSTPMMESAANEMVSDEPLPVVASWETQIRLGDDLSTLAQMAGSTTENWSQ